MPRSQGKARAQRALQYGEFRNTYEYILLRFVITVRHIHSRGFTHCFSCVWQVCVSRLPLDSNVPCSSSLFFQLCDIIMFRRTKIARVFGPGLNPSPCMVVGVYYITTSRVTRASQFSRRAFLKLHINPKVDGEPLSKPDPDLGRRSADLTQRVGNAVADITPHGNLPNPQASCVVSMVCCRGQDLITTAISLPTDEMYHPVLVGKAFLFTACGYLCGICNPASVYTLGLHIVCDARRCQPRIPVF